MMKTLKVVTVAAASLAIAGSVFAQSMTKQDVTNAGGELKQAQSAENTDEMSRIIEELEQAKSEGLTVHADILDLWKGRLIALEKSPLEGVGYLEECYGNQKGKTRLKYAWRVFRMAVPYGLHDKQRKYLKIVIDESDNKSMLKAAYYFWIRDFAQGEKEKAEYALKALLVAPESTSAEQAMGYWQTYYSYRGALEIDDIVHACRRVLLAYIPSLQSAGPEEATKWQEFLGLIKLLREELK